jgi:hypothetical protein
MNAITTPPDGGILATLLTGQVTHGVIARWSENAGWTTREGQPLPSPMLLLGFGTVLRRWKDKRPHYITEQPLPDPETLNSAIPVEEWEKDLNGNPTPPWKYCYVFYLVHTDTGRLYTFAHDTYGTLLCYEAIKEQCFVKQWLTGMFVMPDVQLSKAPWKSAKYGMQMGPRLEPIGWREPPRTGSGNLATTAPTPQLSAPTSAPTSTPTILPWETITEVTEEVAPKATPEPVSAPKTAPAYLPKTPPTAAQSAAAIAAKAPLLTGTKPAAKPMTVAESIADELPAHSAPPKDDSGWR